IVRIHAQYELLERGVDEVRDGTGAAPMMRLTPADDARFGGDLHDDGVALHRAPNAERDAVLWVDRERRRIGSDIDDAQSGGRACHETVPREALRTERCTFHRALSNGVRLAKKLTFCVARARHAARERV